MAMQPRENTKGNIVFSLLGALAVVVLLCVQGHSQVVGATLTGVVDDQSGLTIPNAQISITNTATGITTNLTTNSAGFYSASNLIPGPYQITMRADGFRTEIRNGITLTVGEQQVINGALTVGETSQSVQVSGEAPTVELSSAAISETVPATTIRELPLNGRSWTDLSALQPGVNSIETQPDFSSGAARGARGFGNQITMTGGRPQWNNYRLDGVSMNDPQNGGPGSVLGGNLGVDAIQEFSVITTNYSAEYGKTSGGVVNAITRSGTNQFHGSAYEFLRNDALDAANFFDVTKPPFRRNQFGASAGGPVRKNKLFVYGDYEGIRQSKGFTALETVPSPAARSGMLCSAPSSPSACTPTTVTVDPTVQQFLPFWPLPNAGIQPGSNGDIGLLTRVYQEDVTENFFTTRADYKFSDKDSLVATYMFDFTPFTVPGTLGTTQFKSKTGRQLATLEENHIFSSAWMNSARVGYSREAVTNFASLAAINPLANNTSLGVLPGLTAPLVSVPGLTAMDGGLGADGGTIIFWNSFQAYDDAFWTHGAHSLKFGGAVERMQDSEDSLPKLGSFSFGSLSNFLTNVPQRLTAYSNSTLDEYRETLFGLYVQDDWHVRSNLTLNMGLRWEMVTVPTEVQGHLASLINITDPTPHLGSPLYSNSTLHNFEPRVGFAWDPFKTGKTAVRGGFGMFGVLPLPYLLDRIEGRAFPFSLSYSANKLSPGSFPGGAASLLTSTASKASNEGYFQQNAPRSYVMQYNLNVQRELPGQVTATVGYVGSHGVHLPFRADDIDMVLPQSTPAGFLFPSPIGTGTKLNPNFGDILGLLYGESSSYNALQMGVQKVFSHGLHVQGSFTWEKSLDNGSASGFGDQFSNSISSLPFYDLGALRGLSDFDIGRTLTINALWEVPSLKSISAAAWITKGWELGAIYKANEGVPFTPTFGTGGDPLGLNSSDPYDFPDRLTGPGCQSLINPGNITNYVKTQCFSLPSAPNMTFWQANCDTTSNVYRNPATGKLGPEPYPVCFNLRGNSGRNILIGPGLSNLDFSVYKNNYIRRISEAFNVQFRAEFFNILNRPNFNFPVSQGKVNNTNIFNADGTLNPVAGLITSTVTDPREIQVALKLIW